MKGRKSAVFNRGEKMDRVWREINDRVSALEKVVDAMAARLAKLDHKPKPKSTPKTARKKS